MNTEGIIAQIARIKELYATGLSYRKVSQLTGRSTTAIEGVCKRYPPEVIAKVRQLRKQGLSYRAIGKQIDRSKSYVGWCIQANGLEESSTEPTNDDLAGDDMVQFAIQELGGVLVEGVDWPHHRDGGNDLAPVPVRT